MNDSNEIDDSDKDNSIIFDINVVKQDDFTVSSLLNCTLCEDGENDDARSVPTTVILKRVSSSFSKKSDERISSLLKDFVDENACRFEALDFHDDNILDIEIVNSIYDIGEDSDPDEGIELDYDDYHNNMELRKSKCKRILDRLDKKLKSSKEAGPRIDKSELLSSPRKERSQTPIKERSWTPKRERLQRESLRMARTWSSKPLSTKEDRITSPKIERPPSPNPNMSLTTEDDFSLSSQRLQKRLEKIYTREQKIKALELKLRNLRNLVRKAKREVGSATGSETELSDTSSTQTGLEVVRLEF